LPDELYQRLKRAAEKHEMSLAELVRRGVEYITKVYPASSGAHGEWKMPGPLDLGGNDEFFDDPDWRTDLHLTSGALQLVREKQDKVKKYRGKKK